MSFRRIPLYTVIGVLLFLYLPLFIVIFQSFNASRFGGEWTGFTLKWYALLFRDRNIWDAIVNSLLIAAGSSLTAIILGTMSAVALTFFKTRLQVFHRSMIYIPLMVPDILVGISLLILFVALRMDLGLATIFIAHVTFCVSYVAMVVLGRLQDFDFTVIEAAMDLGASWPAVIRRILLPLIAPGVLAGGLMAFILSVDDFVITFFVSGPGSATLPLYIYSIMRHGTPIVINALTTLFLAVTFLIILISKKLMEANQ